MKFSHSTFVLFLFTVLLLNRSSVFAQPVSSNTTYRYFEENKGQVMNENGQTENRVLYRALGKDIDVYITTSGLSYILHTPAEKPEEKHYDDPIKKIIETPLITKARIQHIQMNLQGARIEKSNAQSQNQIGEVFSNYFLTKYIMVENVKRYQKVVVNNIYPGIDWAIYLDANNGGLKYDFIIHPGADASQIKINYTGIEKLEQNEIGYSLKTSLGEINENGLKIYYDNESKTPINAAYKINGNDIRFALDNYDRSQTIVIDPPVVWATFYGSYYEQQGWGLCNDPKGNVYLSGGEVGLPFTNPPGVYTPTGIYANCYAQGSVSKFNKAGVLKWITYYGFIGFGFGVAADKIGHVYLTGRVGNSPAFPFPFKDPGGGAYQQTSLNAPNGTEAYIAQFDTSGALLWATVYGGNGVDIGYAMTCDAANNVYLTGITVSEPDSMALKKSATNPAAYWNTIKWGWGAILAKFDYKGVWKYGSVFSGSNFEYGLDIQANWDGTKIYLTGMTTSLTFPVKAQPGAYTSAPDKGGAYVAEFDTAMTYVWGTRYGGSSHEYSEGIGVDKNDNVYLIGRTSSKDFATLDPGNGAVMQTTNNTLWNSHLTMFSYKRQPVWSTYLTTGGQDVYGYSAAIDIANHLYISNYGGDATFLNKSVPSYKINQPNGGNLVEFDEKHHLVWGTQYGGGAGGASTNNFNNNWYDRSTGCVYFIGGGQSGTTIDPGGGAYYQAGAKDQIDAYIIKMCPELLLKDTVIPPSCAPATQGSATVFPSGGTEPYTYAWEASTGNQTTQTATGLAPGSYSVIVTDANGLTATDIIEVKNGSDVLVIGTTASTSLCTTNNGSIYTSVSGGNSAYTYSWNTGATTSAITGMPAGVYTLTVTDKKGCTKSITDSIKTVTKPILLLSATYTSKCYDNNDGWIQVYSPPYNPPYTYSWSNGVVTTTEQLTGLAPGTYTITSSDVNGCTASMTASLTAPPQLKVDFTSVDANCGSKNGSLTATISGGTTGYTYYWTNVSSATLALTGLSAGSYSILVYDANQCSKSIAGVVNNIGGPTVNATAVATKCYNSSDGTATVTGTGGATPYTYSWLTGIIGQATQTATGLTSGTYTVLVTDKNNCVSSDTVTVATATPITTTTSNKDATCSGNDGTATVIPSGGTSPYTYTWGASAGNQNTQTATGLNGGTYTVTIQDKNNCSVTKTIGVYQPQVVTITTSTVGGSCLGNDGSADATASGGVSPYTFSWSNGQLTTTATGLSQGIYTVTVTDNTGCSTTQTVSVASSVSPTINVTQQNIQCNGSAYGNINIVTSGANGPYTYSWSHSAQETNSMVNGLVAGGYTIVIADKNNCTYSKTVTLTEPPAIDATVNVKDATCGNWDGGITLDPSGGTPGQSGYNFYWSGIPGLNDSTYTGLQAGQYNITVADQYNCNKVIVVIIGNSNASASITLSNKKDAGCNGATDGSASITATGTNTPYTYSWTAPSGGVTGAFTPNASNLGAGVYTITVTDKSNCKSTLTVSIAESGNITFTPASTPASCGNSSGTASVSGLTGNYSYSWSANANNQTTATASGLTAGTYTVKVTDTNGCSSTKSIVVTQSGGFAISAQATNTSCGKNNGTATATVSGGNSPYTYSWSNNETTQTISNLANGIFTVTITDNSGCSSTKTASVSQGSGPTANVNANPTGCTTAIGSASVTSVTGGATPYTYSWSNNATDQSISNLSSGNYTVTITDGLGCSITKSVTVSSPGANIILSIGKTDETCGGKKDGSATINSTTGGSSPYTYSWSTNPSQTTSSITGIASGTYSILVTDANGCSSSQTTSLAKGAGPVADAGIDSLLIEQGEQVQLTGSGVGSYLWNPPTNLSDPAIANPIASPTQSTWYVLTVTDNNGCLDKDSVFVEVEIPCGKLFIPTAFSPNNDGVNDIFRVRGKCINNFHLQVFNRWGELVFESFDINKGWDGYYKGVLENSSVFVFQLKGINSANSENVDVKGNVTLIR